MRLGIMQPYFFPYYGYFQLMNAVDEFVVYDNIEFTKKGWINRNRILQNGTDTYITIPLKNDSDYLDIRERSLADSWDKDRRKMLNKISGAYNKAPHFKSVYPLIEEIILFEDRNLFHFLFHSIDRLRDYLQIKSLLRVASSIPIDHQLRAEKKVIEICRAKNASTYINPTGGRELYSRENFKAAGIELQFLRPGEVRYQQFDREFIPSLSIIDMLMFNTISQVKTYLDTFYTLDEPAG